MHLSKVEYGSPLSKTGKVRALPQTRSNSFSTRFYFSPPTTTPPPPAPTPPVFLLSLSLSIDNATGKINTGKKKRRHIFSLLLYEPYEENSVCGKGRNAKVLIRERWNTWRRMMVVGCIRGSLMEIDFMKVEIRWGNWEKMADVLTGHP